MKFRVHYISMTPSGLGRRIPFSIEIDCLNAQDAMVVGQRMDEAFGGFVRVEPVNPAEQED